jgi:eukaryotic-like serine/threonine-protein kinase
MAETIISKGVFVDSSSKAKVDDQQTSGKMCLACSQTFAFALTHCPKDGTPLIPFGHDENLGKVINEKYKILELVGKGGMGSVYLAEDFSRQGVHVAIKMLHAQLSEDKLSVKRFQQEASAASDLQHPNLIQQYDYGMIDGKTPYLVMEYLQGDSLSEIIREQGPLNPVRALRIFSQVMDGLKFAHDRGVVHRDIKPSNILLINNKGSEDHVKVLDFGLAKLMPWSGKESQHLTKTGEVFGSPIYMSPEQCMGKQLEPSSDIYSLGITLYEALTGKPPFRGQNVVQTASKHLSDPPPPFENVCPELNLPLNLQAVVFTALEKDKVHRYRDMIEFKNTLTFAVTGQGQANARVLGAMTADATQPVRKVDLDMLKSGAGLSNLRQTGRFEQPKRPPLGVMIGGGVLALALVGAAAFMFMSKGTGEKTGPSGSTRQPAIRVPHHCKGTVYYLEVKASPPRSPRSRNYITEVHLQTPSGLVRLSGSVLPRSPLDLQIGKEWEVNYKGDDSGGELEKYTATGNDAAEVSDANNIVENYFARLADRDYEDVFNNMLSENFIKKTYKGLSSEQALKKFSEAQKKASYQDYRNDKERGTADVPAMSMPTGEKLPPAQATKVRSATASEIRIMIDTSMFYARPHGYECFTVKKTESDWRIDSIENIDKASWDAA